jgi:hypothetical protein
MTDGCVRRALSRLPEPRAALGSRSEKRPDLKLTEFKGAMCWSRGLRLHGDFRLAFAVIASLRSQ